MESGIGEEILRLPEEIITEEILTRLPVKSLLRFRCVSKSWCSLISSKKFMKLHLRYSIKSSSLAHHRIVFNTKSGFKHCSLPSLFNETFTDAITYNADFVVDYMRYAVLGSCNGLVCLLRKGKRFILWNPTTKKSNRLPAFDDEMMVGSVMKSGFGFDELNDDYKVFAVLFVVYESGINTFISKVYSLRSNSWEIIEGGEDASSYKGVGTHLSGKLHWYADERGISSFDLNTKVYGVVEQPSFLKGGKVGVLKGCLSMFYYHQKNHIDIWIMKEYGVKESWNKVTTVQYYHTLCDFVLPVPFTIGPNGEVLLIHKTEFKSTLLIYNPKGNEFRRPRMTGSPEFIFHYSGIYVESLASVVPDAQQEN